MFGARVSAASHGYLLPKSLELTARILLLVDDDVTSVCALISVCSDTNDNVGDAGGDGELGGGDDMYDGEASENESGAAAVRAIVLLTNVGIVIAALRAADVGTDDDAEKNARISVAVRRFSTSTAGADGDDEGSNDMEV